MFRFPARRAAAACVVGTLTLAIVLTVSGTATADTAPSSDPSVTPSSTAIVDPAATSTPTTDPSTTTDPTATPTTGAPAATDAATASTTDPAPSVPTVGQDATVDNSLTGVANTGANIAVGSATGGSSVTGVPASGVAPSAAVTSGAATATGGATQDSITQEAAAVATQAAHIVITQLALIVNIGLALSDSGADTVSASTDPAGSGVSLVDTGNAVVTGLGGSTAVTQVVDLLDASQHTSQVAGVTNVGIGVGNTGANVATGAMSGIEPDGTAVAVSWGPAGSSTVGTGSATAVGDQTHTTIVQVAMGTAADNGTLTITQRAVVVNFGAALANSGFDVASASGADATGLLVRGIVLALLAMLQPSAPTTTLSAATASAIGTQGSATVRSGSAVAIGDASTTSVRQVATGGVTGDHQATADQTATVGNFGFAFANTGVNTAGGALPPQVAAQVASIPDAFAGFLQLLATPGTQALWSNDMRIGADLLAASASVAAVESLFQLPAQSGSAGAQVVIRQITGVLDLMIGVAVSGANHASTTVDAASAHGVTTTPQSGASGGAATAVVHTGDAVVDNQQTTTICQVIDVSPSVCSPPVPVTPVTPVAPAVPAAAVAVRPATATAVAPAAATGPAQLAFTGEAGLDAEFAIALAALLAGVTLLLVTRRRRHTVTPC